MTVNEIITSEILSRLEKAKENNEVFHWVKPFAIGAPNAPFSYEKSQEYSGINLLLLENDEYLTYNKIKELSSKQPEKGYHVRKGAKSHLVIFFKKVKLSDEDGQPLLDDDNRQMEKGMLRFYHVFSRQDVVDKDSVDLPSKFQFKKFSHEELKEFTQKVITDFNALITNYCKSNGVKIEITRDGTEAYFNRASNTIRIPDISNFSSAYEYCSAVAHEVIHSTLIPLKRGFDKTGKCIISSLDSYSKEELVAEIGSEIILNRTGIAVIDDREYKENSLAYIQGWSSRLKETARTNELVSAAAQADKACEYVLSFEKQLNKESEMEL